MIFKALKPWIPVIVLAAGGVLFVFGLQNDPRKIPSALINKQAPDFELPVLNLNNFDDKASSFTPEHWRGKVWILNVFASWCVACQIEHPHLVNIAMENPNIDLIGLAYKDKPVETSNWLSRFGNPYDVVIVDRLGQTGIDYGVYGVPETFIIDEKGFIRYKHIGPIQSTFFAEFVEPLIAKKLLSQ
tara:strand:- start:6760 stop:7320 length:561 start_codon:yes stop_codon:yes gene_type:complete